MNSSAEESEPAKERARSKEVALGKLAAAIPPGARCLLFLDCPCVRFPVGSFAATVPAEFSRERTFFGPPRYHFTEFAAVCEKVVTGETVSFEPVLTVGSS